MTKGYAGTTSTAGVPSQSGTCILRRRLRRGPTRTWRGSWHHSTRKSCTACKECRRSWGTARSPRKSRWRKNWLTSWPSNSAIASRWPISSQPTLQAYFILLTRQRLLDAFQQERSALLHVLRLHINEHMLNFIYKQLFFEAIAIRPATADINDHLLHHTIWVIYTSLMSKGHLVIYKYIHLERFI